ncbi:hypothetical protein D7Z26_14585 [Cohnella endophytica]|uniref:GAF domain-containing protein n=1 Tax=Cohnella endophytica TaxID=2419778 RepID=A0A494XXY0_9BACL|nr:GAF domain-containing protein [Cohnella endophytica]RKP52969.1 hypothetical protein D7Z26_14585 [Cohnella endophytica]
MEDRSSDERMLEELHRLRSDIGCDFGAIGLAEGQSGELRWKLVSGNGNDKYREMTERQGKGFSGSVIKVGRAMTFQLVEIVATRRLHEYPLLLAENLRSAYASPVTESAGPVRGVLLVGDRKRRIYRPEDRQRVAEASERIFEIIVGKPAILRSL